MSEIATVQKIEEKTANNGNNYYRLKTDELKYPTITWSIPDELEEGSRVKYDVDKDGETWNLENVVCLDNQENITESGASEDGGSREGDAKADNGSIGDKYTGSDTYIPPELQVAFKEACKDFRDTSEEMNMAEEEEFKSGKTAMHYEVLKKVGTENVGGGE